MNLQWKMNNVVCPRGNMCTCIAKFDNSRFWLQSDALVDVQEFLRQVQEIAQMAGAKVVESKYLLEQHGNWYDLTERSENIVLFDEVYDPETETADYRYFVDDGVVPATGRRRVRYLAPEEVFFLGEA
ncbi:hypothetical protein BCS37_03030 [Selenomonas sp. oral taxon 920]|uniref:hypothetical protein n=1 Tax=Selenomonas sp. oral taxon 920 TaxID=1884263 RepID=UPI000840B3C3|nr:hypothetical protein [Selenomonas sp. oral taxon 920]AOH47479.1 hypothetical protein BCS37_03030 [Selenomonas sp. oral taxon 920]